MYCQFHITHTWWKQGLMAGGPCSLKRLFNHLEIYHKCRTEKEELITKLPLMLMGKPDHLTCLLRNLYAGQEATVGTGHGTTDWLQLRKRVHQGSISSPCLFNLYAECIMRNAGLDEAQAGIKIVGRNINNLRHADDTTLWQKVKKN